MTLSTEPHSLEAHMKILRERKPNLSAQSYLTYKTSLKRLAKISPTYEPAPIIKYVLGLGNPNVARNLLVPLLILKGEVFRETFNRLSDEFEEIRMSQKPTESQLKNVTTLKHIKRMLRRMREDVVTHKLLKKPWGSLNTVQKRLVIAYVSFTLLVDITMRSDLNSIRVVSTNSKATEPDLNYYVSSSGTIILNRFKTYRSFARRRMLPLKLDVKPTTKRVLREYLAKAPGPFLFSLTGSKLTKAAHNNILIAHSHRYLGVRVGTTMLRHIILSEFEKKNPSLRERKEQMKKMQQIQIETQMSYAFRELSN